MLTITDEASGFKWAKPLKRKSDATMEIKNLIQAEQNRLDRKIKSLRSDNGTEFTTGELANYLAEQGIVLEFSAPYTPQQNGRAERSNQSIIQVTRSLMAEGGNTKIPVVLHH